MKLIRSILYLLLIFISSFIFYFELIRPSYLEYKVTHSDSYKSKIIFFNSLKFNNGCVFLIGDSILESLNFSGNKYVNLSIGGETTHTILKRLKLFSFPKNSSIVCMIGINDLLFNKSLNEIKEHQFELLSHFCNNENISKIYLFGTLPISINGFFFDLNEVNLSVLDLNNYSSLIPKIESHNFNKKIIYVDCYSLFSDTNNILKAKYNFDGVHLNEMGKIALKKNILNVTK